MKWRAFSKRSSEADAEAYDALHDHIPNGSFGDWVGCPRSCRSGYWYPHVSRRGSATWAASRATPP